MASSNATPPDDEERSIFENNANYYKILGVKLNATECDIKQAYRSKAKQLHPDRHPHISDELFKNLAKAYEVLSDSVKRTEYNEKIDDSESDTFDYEDPVGSLLSGPRMSECWRKHYHESLKLRDDCGIMNFMDALNKKMDEFQKEQFSYLVCTSKRKQASQEDDCQEDVSTDICDEMMNSVHEAIHSSDTLKSTEEHNGALQKVIHRMQTTSSEVKSVGSNVPILDFECLGYSDLLILLSDFVSEEEVAVLRKLKHKELIEKMVTHIPEAKVLSVPDSEESTQCKKCKEKFFFFFNPSYICKPCGNVYCKKCVPHKIKYPRYGIMKSIPTCQICFQSNAQLDEDDWQELGIASLKTGAAETLWKAMGCFTMALHCSTNSFGTMSRLAEELLSLSLTEMVLPILSVLLQITQEEKEKRSIYLLLSNLTLRLASESNTCWDSKHLFLKIAKEACSKASKASSSNNDLRIDKMFQEIQKASTTFNNEMQNYHSNLVLDKRELIDAAFEKRDWYSVLDIATEEKDDEMIEIVMKDSTVEALSQFLNDKEHYMNEMLPEDRFPLIFIRGLVKLQEGAIKSGIHDIETAAWSGNQIEWLRKASVGAIVGQMENVKGYIPHQQITEACNQLKMYISDFFVNPNSEKLHPDLLPKMEELDPSQYQRIWPNLFVEGIESKALEKYEKAIIKSVKHGKISKFDAALACVDLVQACSHFAEIGMCFLYAMFWLHEDLIEKIRKNVKKEERYALKCLIMYTIQNEQTLSQLRLHPGMQFIMAQRSLGIALSTLKLSGELVTPEDSEIVVGLFQSIVYNCRLCPFWNAPPIGISEAVLLNIVSGQLHCEYILNMQNIESDVLPIHVSELHYQIYENDLKHLAQLKNSKNAHARAMEEMMKEKDLTWEDVSGALTCPLTPCDLDGWLTVQSTLGGSPEYSGLKGFVFDTDDKKHSLEILVTSPRFWNRQKGLFSQDDIHAMLQCDLAEIFPIFFSLDQPNPNQRFHPFQQMRYSPEALAGSNVLYTLFHTDYLLKSFSVGSEVSSQPPFEQRKCSNGLTANLPLHLQNILSSISERGETGSQSIHRFWIQAEELKYDVSQHGSKIEYRISEPKMVVRSHPLLPGLDGELRDAKEKDDPNSPEAKFAAELTEHYSVIADHFPMFARLKELCKLQFLCFAINATLSCLKDKSEGTGWNVTDEMVESIHKSERKAQRNNLKNGLRQSRQSIPSEHRSNSQAIYQLTNSLENLCKQRVDRSSMEYYVSEWLRYNRDSDLIEMIVSTFPLTTRHEIHQTLVEKFKSEYNSFKSEVITLKEAAKLNTTSKGQCDWVPAAMMKKDDEASYSLCYGGVLFAPKYIQQPIPRTSSSRVPIQPKPPMPPTSAMRSFFSFWGQKEPSRYSSSKGTASLLSKPKYNSHDWKNRSNRDQTNRKNGRDAFLAMATFLVIRRDDRGRKNERKDIKHQKHIPIETIKQQGAHAIKRGANPSTSLTNFLGSGKKSQTTSCGDKRCKCCQFINGSENSGTIVGGYTCKDRNVIYRLTDTRTGKYYIGMTTNQMNKRIIGGHCCKGTVFEYFKGNFEHMRVEVIEHHPGATRKELRAHEKRIIESYPKEKLINKMK